MWHSFVIYRLYGSPILQFAIFQVAWFVAILGSKHHRPDIFVIFLLVWLLIHFCLRADKRRQDAIFLFSVLVLGTLIESLFIARYVYIPTSRDFAFLGLCPLWLSGLWVSFGMCFDTSLRWLQKSFTWGFVLGLVGSPLSFLAAERLGALVLHPNHLQSLLPIALVWAFTVPLLAFFSRRVYGVQ